MPIRTTLALLLLPFCALATQSITIPMHLLDKSHTAIGSITASNTANGLKLVPKLHDLPPGPHGFHVHTQASCADAGMAAGGHYDPQHSDTHLGPYKHGHRGDLPRLFVNDQGKAVIPMIAPHLKLQDLKHRSLIIHAGGDNYSDHPKPLGGGGKRIACGLPQ